jgi:DNA-binding MarR family transcriptional regulator
MPGEGRETAREEQVRRVGASVREIRRSAAMMRVRALVLGGSDSPLELGGADTLNFVCERGGSRMSELADALRVDASTATRAVARLETAGLVRREGDERDRRAVIVVPTQAGMAAQVQMRTQYLEVMKHICAEFDDDDVAVLADHLERLVAGIDALPDA